MIPYRHEHGGRIVHPSILAVARTPKMCLFHGITDAESPEQHGQVTVFKLLAQITLKAAMDMKQYELS